MKRPACFSPVSALLLLAGAAVGCGNKGSGEAAPGTSAAPSVASSVTTLAASARAEPKPGSAQAELSVVAQAPDEFILYPLKGGAFVDAGGLLAVLGAGPLKQSPSVMKGLEKGPSGKILGAFPDGAWLLADVTYKWVNDRWAATDLLREGEKLLDIAAWDNNRAVAAIAMPNNDMRFFLVGGKSGVVMPAPSGGNGVKKDVKPAASGDEAAPPSDDKPAEPDASCKVKMKPEGLVMAGLPSGELYAAGYECQESGRGAAIIERWEPKKVRGTIEPLPKVDGADAVELRGVVARSPTEVWVYGGAGSPRKPYLARWDGKAWSLAKLSFPGTIATISAADDGTLWAVVPESSGTCLWKRPAGAEAFMAVPLDPVGGAPITAQAVYARTAADVWVAAKTQSGKGLLLRSGTASGPPVELPSRADMNSMISSNRRWIATPVCDKVYAHLYTFGPSTGDVPKDFSGIKDIFAQKDFADLNPIVEDDGASLYVGVPVPSLAVGKALLDAYRAKNPKAAPNLFCHEPVIVKKAIKFL